MKGKFVKYWVLLIFIFIAVILYLLGVIIAGYIYDRLDLPEDLLDQIFDKMYFTFKFLAVYILLLFSIVAAGVFWSRKKKEKEVYKGFIYSLFFSMLILVIYLAALTYLFH